MSFFPQPSVSKILASGTTAGSAVTITPPADKQWEIENIIMTNESGASIRQVVQINDGADITIYVGDIADDGRHDAGSLFLDDTQNLKFVSTTGIQYTIFGKELG